MSRYTKNVLQSEINRFIDHITTEDFSIILDFLAQHNPEEYVEFVNIKEKFEDIYIESDKELLIEKLRDSLISAYNWCKYEYDPDLIQSMNCMEYLLGCIDGLKRLKRES